MMVYAIHAALLALALRRVGLQPVTVVLGLCMVSSWFVGTIREDVNRTVGMILLDLTTVLALHSSANGGRARMVALISQTMILWRGLHLSIVGSYIDYWTYVAVINVVTAVQFLIGGGLADAVGHWIDDRAGRLSPRLQSALRMVAC